VKKILIADDDKKIVTALSVRLKAAGYEVLTAQDGFEGLKLTVAERPDLLILDIWMPVGLGFSLAQRLKALGLAEVPIIFLTASRKPGLRAAAEGLGAAAFFEKPYDGKELLATVARVLKMEWKTPSAPSANATASDSPGHESRKR